MDRCEEQISSSSFGGVQTCKVEEGASDLQNYETPSLEDFKFKQEEEEIIDCQISNKQLKEEEEIIDYQIPNKRLKLTENNQEDPLKLEETPTDVLEPFCAVFVEDHQEDSMSPELDEDDKSKITELQSESNSSLSQNAELIDHKGLCIVPVGVGVGLNTVTGGWSSIPQNDSGNDTVEPQMGFRAVAGTRRGAQLFTCGDGYYYYGRYNNHNKCHYRCYKRNCDARMFVFLHDQTIGYRNTKFPWHDHSPQFFLEGRNELRDKIIARALKESLPCRKIYEEECRKVSEEVSSMLPYGKIDAALQNARKKCCPPLPNSLVELDESLTSVKWKGRFGRCLRGEEFYRGNETVEGENNLFFMSEDMRRSNGNAKELYLYSTSKLAPSVPGLKQLFVVIAEACSCNYGYPLCYVLMEAKSKSSYKRIFSLLKRLVPGMNPKAVYSDFERNVMEAAREEFPDADVTGCWWYYAVKVSQKAKSLSLQEPSSARCMDNVSKVIHMCMALPFLPAASIETGLAVIREYVAVAPLGAALTNTFDLLFNYIQSQWIQNVGVDRLTVCGAPRRTTNHVEVLFANLKREIGFSPFTWSFIDGIKNLDNTYSEKMKIINSGRQLTRTFKEKIFMQERQVKMAMRNYSKGRIKDRELLSTIAAVIDRNLTIPPEEKEVEEDKVNCPPSPAKV